MAKDEKKKGFLASIGNAIDKGLFEAHHLLRTGHFSPVGSYDSYQGSINDSKTTFKPMDAPKAGQAIEKKPPFNVWSYMKQQHQNSVTRRAAFDKAITSKVNTIQKTIAKDTQIKAKESVINGNKAYAEQLKTTPDYIQAANKQFDSLQKSASPERINGKEQAYPFSGKFMPQRDIQQLKDLAAEIKNTKDPEGVSKLKDVRNSIVQQHKNDWKQDPQAYSHRNAENYLTNSQPELKSAAKGHEEAFRHNPAAFEQAQKPQMEQIATNQQNIAMQIEKGELAHQAAEKSQKLDKSEQFQTVQHSKNDRQDNEQYAVITGRMTEQQHLQQRTAELMQGVKEKMSTHAVKAAEAGKALEANKSLSEDRGASQAHAVSHDM